MTSVPELSVSGKPLGSNEQKPEAVYFETVQGPVRKGAGANRSEAVVPNRYPSTDVWLR